MQELRIQEEPKLIEWYDLWFSPFKRTGYVAITSNFKQHYFYGANDIKQIINVTKGQKKQFISINGFHVDWQKEIFSRKSDNLKQIRNIAIDIDQYNLGLSIDETLDQIKSLINTKRIPTPNLVSSSRGIQLFYSIEKGAAPDMSWLTSIITEQLISKLHHLGADHNAKDLSRYMRVPDSINERNDKNVDWKIWANTTYSLQHLQTYCKPLDKFSSRKKKQSNVVQLPLNDDLKYMYRTNQARLIDLRKLIDLRNGDLTGMRNTFLYMYSFHQSLTLSTQKDVIDSARATFSNVYSRFKKPMSNYRFESTVKSAYKDAGEFFAHIKANDYKVIVKQRDGIIKPFTNKNAIDKLDITEDEQMEMRSLRTKDVEKKQRTLKARLKRQINGMSPQEIYNKSRQDKQLNNIKRLADLLETHPEATQKELAEIMELSPRTIRNYMKTVEG